MGFDEEPSRHRPVILVSAGRIHSQHAPCEGRPNLIYPAADGGAVASAAL